MIDKKISVSEDVANISYQAQLLFTWSIPHADDIGLLPGSLKTLKAMIVPMWEIEFNAFIGFVNEIVNAKLWLPFNHSGDTFFRIPKFTKHQTLKKDRQPQTLLKIELDKDPKKSWHILEALGFQVEDEEYQMDTEYKGSEEKRSKANMPKGLLKRISKTPPNPNIKPLMEFFYKAVKIIRNMEPPEINTGKVGAILKRRLENDKIEPHRIECMSIWFLTRTKKFKDNRSNWQETFKNAPDMGVMLSDAYFSQLLSDEANIIVYMRDNFDWVDKIYKKIEPKKFVKITEPQKLGDILKNKFNKD